MSEIKQNKAGEVLFREFRNKTNAESLDELDGYTIRVYSEEWRYSHTPKDFYVDHDAKEIQLVI